MRAQFTITIPTDLAEYVEKRVREEGATKSAVIARALEEQRRREEEELMREGYIEMAEHDRELMREWG